MAQIESPNAVKNARAIAEVDGIDMLFFGPGDFSVLSGIPGEFRSPVVQEAVKQTCHHALAAGKRFGTLVPDLEYAKNMLDIGTAALLRWRFAFCPPGIAGREGPVRLARF
jgi:4-hydroxy-2-oxoheptanedioate aldolase